MEKAKSVRRAGLVAWATGLVFTIVFVHPITGLSWAFLPLVAAACTCIQYVLSIVQSAIFDGSIPPPWSLKKKSFHIWLWTFGMICLIIDVMLNIGGIAYIVSRFKGDIASIFPEVAGMETILRILIVAFCVFLAIGPELMKQWAAELHKEKPIMEELRIKEPKNGNRSPSEIKPPDYPRIPREKGEGKHPRNI